jgi:hypothetical protein
MMKRSLLTPTKVYQGLWLCLIALCLQLNLIHASATVSSAGTLSPSTSYASSSSPNPFTLSSGTGAVVSTEQERKNMAVQLFGYVKDSVVRTVDGCGELWTNYGRCQAIRKQQEAYRQSYLEQHPALYAHLTPKQQKEALNKIPGGISYPDYLFLQKGKEDRGKLLNVVFLMWGAPKFLPYALMFNPDMLPSPFHPQRHSMAAQKAAQRPSIILSTLIQLERQTQTMSPLAKFNIFGNPQKKQSQLLQLAHATHTFLETPGHRGRAGAQAVLHQLHPHLFTREPLTRAQTRLVGVPSVVISGLQQALQGVPGGGLLAQVTPNMLHRNSLVGTLRKLTEADVFLKHSVTDLHSLPHRVLWETCQERCLIATPWNDSMDHKDQCVQALQEWLDVTLTMPARQLQQRNAAAAIEDGSEVAPPPQWYYNDNLARVALLSYYGLEMAREAPTVGTLLARSLFAGGAAVQSVVSNNGYTCRVQTGNADTTAVNGDNSNYSTQSNGVAEPSHSNNNNKGIRWLPFRRP